MKVFLYTSHGYGLSLCLYGQKVGFVCVCKVELSVYELRLGMGLNVFWQL